MSDSKDVENALASECGHDLDFILELKKPEYVETLREFVSADPSIDPVRRAKALYLLGRLNDVGIVPQIIAILPHLDERGRASAVDALGQFGTRESLQGVIAQSDDRSAIVRKIAVRVLGTVATHEARAKLQERAASDPIPYIRKLASKPPAS